MTPAELQEIRERCKAWPLEKPCEITKLLAHIDELQRQLDEAMEAIRATLNGSFESNRYVVPADFSACRETHAAMESVYNAMFKRRERK